MLEIIDIVSIIISSFLFIISTFLVFKQEKYLLWVPLFLICTGQMLRLPIAVSQIGILTADLLIPWIIFLWFIKKLIIQRTLPKTHLGLSIYLFIGALTLSLFLAIPTLPTSEFATSLFYLIRQAAYLLFFFPIFEAFTKYDKSKFIKHIFIASIILCILGILQFIYVPDFTFMAKAEGWDPHIGRLLSTWYDPNFIAGFFAFIISLFSSLYIDSKEKLKHLGYPLGIILLTSCFILTYSRSGIVALAVSILIIAILRARSLLIIGLIGLFLGITISDRFSERFYGMIDSAIATITGSLDHDVDLTSQERIASYEQVGIIISDHYLFGIGFNNIKYYKLSKGLVADPNKHSASGSDSSLLNIFMTSGIFGLCFFFYFLYSASRMSLILFLQSKKYSMAKGFGLGMFASLIALFFHSFFVNSLLYPLFLLILMPLLGLLENLYQEMLDISNNSMNKQRQESIPE